MGCVRGFSRKTPGKSRENCWINFPKSRTATNSRISDTGKSKPAGNPGSVLPGPCPHLPWGVFFEIDSSNLLEFFLLSPARARGNIEQCQVVFFIVDDLRFAGPALQTPVQSSVSTKNPVHMLRNLTRSMYDASPHSICCTERKRGF